MPNSTPSMYEAFREDWRSEDYDPAGDAASEWHGIAHSYYDDESADLHLRHDAWLILNDLDPAEYASLVEPV